MTLKEDVSWLTPEWNGNDGKDYEILIRRPGLSNNTKGVTNILQGCAETGVYLLALLDCWNSIQYYFSGYQNKLTEQIF